MTPYQFAHLCANFQEGGRCDGPRDVDRGAQTVNMNRPKCLLALGERCAYFETNVLEYADMATVQPLAAELQDAAATYRKSHGLNIGKVRSCPDCGGPLPKSRQYCSGCALKRKRQNARDSQRKKRNGAPASPTASDQVPQ